MVFLEPPSVPAAMEGPLRERLAQQKAIIVLDAGRRTNFWTQWMQKGDVAPAVIDSRVASAVAEINARLCEGVARLPDFAAFAGLSPC